MNPSLWTVEFMTSSISQGGAGVAVFTENNRILGGDVAYYYIGTYEINDNKIKGEIEVIRFNQMYMSVFGDVSDFTLTFDGILEGDKFVATAVSSAYPGIELKIVGNKKEELV